MTESYRHSEARERGKDKLEIVLLLCSRGLRPIAFARASSLPVRRFSLPFAPRLSTTEALQFLFHECWSRPVAATCAGRALVVICDHFVAGASPVADPIAQSNQPNPCHNILRRTYA